MNPQKSLKPGLPRFVLTFICGSLLTAIPANAQISVVSTDDLINNSDLTTYSLSFNAGAASKLIVSAGSETTGVAITGIKYNGVALTLIPNTASGRNRGIWYLDNPFSGGAANIIVTGASTLNHMRLGVASISGSAPGAAIGNIASAASVSLNVPVTNSFVFAAHASNWVSPEPGTVLDPPLTKIFSTGGDSARHAAGYQNLVAAGPATYSFTNTDSPESSVAAFVPASAAPVLISTVPADNVTQAAIGANLVANFSEPVVKGTGNIELWQVGGSLVESFDADTSPQLAFSGQTLTINPTSNLTPGVGYYVLIPATAVVDTSGGNAFAGIKDPTVWNFTADITPPTLATLSPVDGATFVAVNANLVATFNEAVAKGTGNIELWQAGGASPVESFDVATSPQVTVSGASLTINPTADLSVRTSYYVIVPATAVKDLSGNFFSGLALDTHWNFSTSVNGTWTGTTSGAWLTGTNWSGSLVPGSESTTTNTDGARFDVATQPTVGIDMNATGGNSYLGVIDFDDTTARNIGNSSSTTPGVLTLNGAMLDTVANTILYNRNTALLTIQATQGSGLAMGLALGNATNNIARITGTGGITISSSITGTDKKLTKLGIGTGILTLSGATNSYSGGTDILAGTVQLSASAAAGSSTIQLGATTGSNTAELRLTGTGTNVANALTVNAGSSGTKTLANRGSNTVFYSGLITANGDLSIVGGFTAGGFTINNASNTIASGKTVAFSNTGTATNATTDSALWGGLGSISYTSSSATGFAISGAKTYSGGATLGAMSGAGIVTVSTSSTGPANAPDNGAFGKGTLSIGATKMRAGTAGDITIGNPVTFTDNPTFTTVASEKSLIFSGNASLGATRTLTVETGSTVTTKAVEFSGEISGTGFGITKAGAGALRLSGTNTYTGDTMVNAGVLAVSGTSIANTGTLVINGGTVDLTNTETVNKLFFGIVEQPVGNYSATSVPGGATITTTSFTGTGTLTVGAPAGSAYSLWAATNAPTTGTNPNADEDDDGVSNAVEFVLGGTIGSNDLGKLPTPAVSGGNMTFTFKRAVASIDPKTTLTIEVSSDLVTWNTPPSPYAVPDAATGPVNPGVTVVEDTSPGFDTVTLTVPKDAASKFARIKVIQLP